MIIILRSTTPWKHKQNDWQYSNIFIKVDSTLKNKSSVLKKWFVYRFRKILENWSSVINLAYDNLCQNLIVMDFTLQLNPHLEVYATFSRQDKFGRPDTIGFSCSLHYHQKHLKTDNCRFSEYMHSFLLKSGKSLLN